MDALYFPYLSLPSSAWTNPVALYFDSIGKISPYIYDHGISDERTTRFIDVGLVRPIFGAGGAWDH